MSQNRPSQIQRMFQADREQVLTELQGLFKTLCDQRQEGRTSPATVRSFYQTLHTLKAMLGTEAFWAETLSQVSQLEGMLACTPLIESSRQSDRWLPQAEQVIQWVSKKILERHSTSSSPLAAVEGGVSSRMEVHEWGILVGVVRENGAHKKVWISIRRLLRVLSPDELSGRTVISMNGRWVPVMGQADRNFFGLYFETQDQEQFLVSVSRIFKVCQKSEAMQQHACFGEKDFFGFFSTLTK